MKEMNDDYEQFILFRLKCKHTTVFTVHLLIKSPLQLVHFLRHGPVVELIATTALCERHSYQPHVKAVPILSLSFIFATRRSCKGSHEFVLCTAADFWHRFSCFNVRIPDKCTLPPSVSDCFLLRVVDISTYRIRII
jgi:hypothetical protein